MDSNFNETNILPKISLEENGFKFGEKKNKKTSNSKRCVQT